MSTERRRIIVGKVSFGAMDNLFDDYSRLCDCVLSVSHLKAESPARRLHFWGDGSNMSFIFWDEDKILRAL